MPERLKTGDKLVGSKQTRKAIREGRAKTIYIAQDADSFVTEPVRQMAADSGLEIVFVPSMEALGQACGVEVPTACAALL